MDWWHSSDCLIFFVLVISFTLYLKIFLSSLKALTGLDDLYEELGSGVKPLDDEFFLPLLWECKLYQLKDLVF